MVREDTRTALVRDRWFEENGAYVSVDGQFGSSGKGVLNALLAEVFGHEVRYALTNAGPNSGHVSHILGQKIVLKQLPTFSVASHLFYPNKNHTAILTAGAVIDPVILAAEKRLYPVSTLVHPCAAVIRPEHRREDATNVRQVASTGMGVGPAIASKIGRTERAVYGWLDGAAGVSAIASLPQYESFFVEVSQGFSLGINQPFYPCVTSRECTVSQALADAGLSPTAFRRSFMSVRTFPIRVGNTESSSGPCYPDQEEITWDSIGVAPELTTVTGRQRRLFSWSDLQFQAACRANTPSGLFINFMNYLPPNWRRPFLDRAMHSYASVMGGTLPTIVLLGFGPTSEDVFTWRPGTEVPVPMKERH